MSCHNKSRPEMTYWTAGNVVKRFFSTPWQNKIEKRRKFKSYFVCKMVLKPPKVEVGKMSFHGFTTP